MICYSKLLYEYTHSKNRWKDPYITFSEKRLRWLKYEAYGNSNNTTTAFNIRHAHICNRNLQQKLGIQLSYFSNIHGKNCNEIEIKQTKLWREMKRREQQLSTNKKRLLVNRSQEQTPFSTHKDYAVFHHIEAQTKKPIEHIDQSEDAGRVELLRFDRKRKQEVVVISTRRNNSLRSEHQIYGNEELTFDYGAVEND